MGRRRAFIDKKTSTTYSLIYRGGEADGGSERIFVRTAGRGAALSDSEDDDAAPQAVPEPSTRRYPPGHPLAWLEEPETELTPERRREILELGLPDDGYDYLQHLRDPIGAKREKRNAGGDGGLQGIVEEVVGDWSEEDEEDGGEGEDRGGRSGQGPGADSRATAAVPLTAAALAERRDRKDREEEEQEEETRDAARGEGQEEETRDAARGEGQEEGDASRDASRDAERSPSAVSAAAPPAPSSRRRASSVAGSSVSRHAPARSTASTRIALPGLEKELARLALRPPSAGGEVGGAGGVTSLGGDAVFVSAKDPAKALQGVGADEALYDATGLTLLGGVRETDEDAAGAAGGVTAFSRRARAAPRGLERELREVDRAMRLLEASDDEEDKGGDGEEDGEDLAVEALLDDFVVAATAPPRGEEGGEGEDGEDGGGESVSEYGSETESESESESEAEDEDEDDYEEGGRRGGRGVVGTRSAASSSFESSSDAFSDGGSLGFLRSSDAAGGPAGRPAARPGSIASTYWRDERADRRPALEAIDEAFEALALEYDEDEIGDLSGDEVVARDDPALAPARLEAAFRQLEEGDPSVAFATARARAAAKAGLNAVAGGLDDDPEARAAAKRAAVRYAEREAAREERERARAEAQEAERTRLREERRRARKDKEEAKEKKKEKKEKKKKKKKTTEVDDGEPGADEGVVPASRRGAEEGVVPASRRGAEEGAGSDEPSARLPSAPAEGGALGDERAEAGQDAEEKKKTTTKKKKKEKTKKQRTGGSGPGSPVSSAGGSAEPFFSTTRRVPIARPLDPHAIGEDAPRERWDCETVLTMRTNLDNHPGMLSEPREARRKPRRARAAQPAAVSDAPLVLDAAGVPVLARADRPGAAGGRADRAGGRGLGAPAPAAPRDCAAMDVEGDAASAGASHDALPAAASGPADGALPPAGQPRSRDETAEEKRARKAAVKADKRAARDAKRATKEAFKKERAKAGRRAATAQPQAALHLP